MPKAQPTTKQDSTKQAILRMSSAVEDAPYELDSIALLNARVTASCRGDNVNVGRLIDVASCGDPGIAHAASCGMDDPNVRRLKEVASCATKEPRT
jgi:hypothetical protein